VRRPPTKGMLPPPRVRRGSLRVGGREHL
jgi:hypothetical protein